jgi:hypothetical protein
LIRRVHQSATPDIAGGRAPEAHRPDGVPPTVLIEAVHGPATRRRWRERR